MYLNFVNKLVDYLKSEFPDAKLPADWSIAVEACPGDMNGDYTVNCFKFARLFGMAPDKLAAKIGDYLSTQTGEIDQVEIVKAFINITLNASALMRDTLSNAGQLMNDALLPEKERQRILVEYSAPNTNKPQHLGHVRNNTLGMSLAALLKRVGNEVIQINLVNDRGIHICKSMMAYKLRGNGMTPESSGLKGDHLAGKFYVEYNKMLSEEIKNLRSNRPELADKDSEDLFLETELGKATQKMLQDWESNDPEVIALWKKMNSWVFAGFAETYKRMGIKFDHTYLESETYLLGKDIVADGVARKVFTKREDGAVIADLGKLGQKVVLRSDGTSVYITQDIGTTLKKQHDYEPDTQIWVVGDEQILHFQMLFAIIKKLGYNWADNLYHMAYGMVNLPSGKMKSREGTVVDADELFQEMVDLAAESCRERYGSEVSEAEIKTRAEIIGMGALKFMLLKFNPKTTMMFDPQSSIKFEGDTGPYVQYACARIASIKRKAAESGIEIDLSKADWSKLSSPAEKALAVTASFYGNTLRTAAERRDASVLVEYLLNLAKSFNRFYRECPVMTAESDELRLARLAACETARQILTDGLNTLTIEVPSAM